MSYILDALRRAERERERGGVPGLHAQPLGGATPATAPSGTGRTGLLAAMVLALVLAAGLGWWLAPRAVTPPPVAAGPTGPTSSVVAGAAWPSVPPQPPAPTTAPTTASTTASTTATTAATPPAPPQAPRVAVQPGAPAPTAPAAGPNPAAKPATSTAATAAAGDGTTRAPMAQAGETLQPATATAPTGRTVAYDQLPADVKRQLPNLNLGGAIYSDTPSARMLLVNGQLLHEGDVAAPGVVLETIRQRSAVLRWRELRYEMQW